MFLFDLVGLNIFHVGHSHTLPPWHVPNILWTWKLGLGSKHIIQKFVATPTDLEKVIFMPRFVMVFYESWRTKKQYSCARILHLELPSAQWVPKKAEGRDMPNGILATCSPDPSNPNLCAAWLEAAWQIPLGFMYATSAAIHIFHLTGWMTWIIFLNQRQGSIPIPWTFCFIQPTSTAGFASQPTTPSQFEKPSKHLFTCDFCLPRQTCLGFRVKVTWWSSSFESPTFENFKKQPATNWDLCIPLPVLAPPTCSSTPATGPQELLYTRDI